STVVMGRPTHTTHGADRMRMIDPMRPPPTVSRVSARALRASNDGPGTGRSRLVHIELSRSPNKNTALGPIRSERAFCDCAVPSLEYCTSVPNVSDAPACTRATTSVQIELPDARNGLTSASRPGDGAVSAPLGENE